MALTQDQIDFYWENGYLSYGKVLDGEKVELLRVEYDIEFQKAQDSKRMRNLSAGDGAGAKTTTQQQMLQIIQMSERNIRFRELLYDTRILDVIQDLIGPNILLFHDQALYKPAHTGGPVLWHQDNAYWKCRPATLVSCWLTLDDVDRENGAMQVIPGSHLKPVWHEQSEETNALQEIKGVDESAAKVIDLPAGGCMFHHCQTLHYTQPNTTDRQRRAFAIHFMPPGTRGQDGEVMRVGFGRPALRLSI